MLEREATFDQLQRQHGAAEASVAASLQHAEAERKRLAALSQQCQDLEKERKKLVASCEQHQNALRVSKKTVKFPLAFSKRFNVFEWNNKFCFCLVLVF